MGAQAQAAAHAYANHAAMGAAQSSGINQMMMMQALGASAPHAAAAQPSSCNLADVSRGAASPSRSKPPMLSSHPIGLSPTAPASLTASTLDNESSSHSGRSFLKVEAGDLRENISDTDEHISLPRDQISLPQISALANGAPASVGHSISPYTELTRRAPDVPAPAGVGTDGALALLAMRSGDSNSPPRAGGAPAARWPTRARPRTFRGRTPGPEILFYLYNYSALKSL